MTNGKISFAEAQKFQLRAYLFQARNLIGSDNTGLSDPFARVIIYNQCQETHVIDATLSPAWDQTLVFKDVIIHGSLDMILNTPPIVMVEIFDHDTVVSILALSSLSAIPLSAYPAQVHKNITTATCPMCNAYSKLGAKTALQRQ